MKAEDRITQKDIDSLHDIFMMEIKRLFDRTKRSHKGYENAELQIF